MTAGKHKSSPDHTSHTTHSSSPSPSSNEIELGLIKAVVEQAGHGMVVCDNQGQVVFMNSLAYSLLNLSKKEPSALIGEEWFHANQSDNSPISNSSTLITKALQGEPVSTGEITLRETGGEKTRATISASPLYGSNGLIIGAVADISEVPCNIDESRWAEAEQTIQDLSYRYALLENVHDAIVGIDTNFIVNYWNKAAEGLYGWSAEEALGRNLNDTLHCGLTVDQNDYVLKKLKQGEPYSMDLKQRGKGGRPLNVEATGLPIYMPDGKIQGYVAVVRDISERELLKGALSRIRHLVDSNMVGITTSDKYGNILEANNYYLNLTGFSRSELEAGQALWTAITPREYLKVDLEALKELEARGICEPFEKEYIRRDGSRVWVSVSCTMLPGEDGLFMAFVQDISARKQAEQERQTAVYSLQESQQKLNDILESINDGFASLDRSWRFIYINRKASEIAGREPQDLLGQNLWDVWPELKGSWAARHYLDVMEKRVPSQIMVQDPSSDIIYEINLYPSEEGVTLFVIDKTESYRKEQALRESEERFRSLVESMDDVVFTLDTGGNYTGIYGKRLDRKSIVAEDGMQENPLEVLLSQAEPFHLQANQRALQGEEVTYEWSLPVDGAIAYYQTRLSPIHASNGEVCGAVGVGRDITELKRVEEILAKYTNKLEASNRELEEFAYVASHDLQEPLRKIRQFGKNLQETMAGKLSDEEQVYLERIQNASERMKEMIEDLLQLSRVNSQGRPFEMVDLNQLAAQVTLDLEVRIHQTDALLEFKELPVILADHRQIYSLFLNLIGNAIKYHQEDIRPVVKVYSITTPEAEGPAQLQNQNISSQNSTFTLVFEDNGIGFEMEYLDRIFQPFQRLVGRSQYEGTGMGLAICKKIVERHGGTITATSQPGVGSHFLVTLPNSIGGVDSK